MVQAFLIKYAEIGIKGKNRYVFEDALVRRVKERLERCEGDFVVEKEQGRIYVEAKSEFDEDEVITALTHVFGIAHICPVVLVEDKSFDNVCEKLVEHMKNRLGDKPLPSRCLLSAVIKNTKCRVLRSVWMPAAIF